MTTVLIVALVFAVLMCIVLALLCYYLLAKMDRNLKFQEYLWKQEHAERAEKDQYLSGVPAVLNTNVGGISKRISESAEVAEALHMHAPEVFRKCSGLAYWLHANDEFLSRLYAKAANGISHDHQWRIAEWEKSGRDEVFRRIYKSAGLTVPSFMSDGAKSDDQAAIV